MQSWFNEARRHAAEIHDVVQIAAGATALAAVLVFVTLSGRSQDDPVVRWMAEVGATMVASEIIIPATPAKADDALVTDASAAMPTSIAQPDVQTFDSSPAWTARRSNTNSALAQY